MPLIVALYFGTIPYFIISTFVFKNFNWIFLTNEMPFLYRIFILFIVIFSSIKSINLDKFLEANYSFIIASVTMLLYNYIQYNSFFDNNEFEHTDFMVIFLICYGWSLLSNKTFEEHLLNIVDIPLNIILLYLIVAIYYFDINWIYMNYNNKKDVILSIFFIFLLISSTKYKDNCTIEFIYKYKFLHMLLMLFLSIVLYGVTYVITMNNILTQNIKVENSGVHIFYTIVITLFSLLFLIKLTEYYPKYFKDINNKEVKNEY